MPAVARLQQLGVWQLQVILHSMRSAASGLADCQKCLMMHVPEAMREGPLLPDVQAHKHSRANYQQTSGRQKKAREATHQGPLHSDTQAFTG